MRDENKKVAADLADAARTKPELLPDVPTPDDAFGPYRALADAIADLIESDEGGKAIALEGGWGTGKSSIVLMLKKRLEGDEPAKAVTRVHIFDAWSHEGDPLRRAFLEKLTSLCTARFKAKRTQAWKEREKKEITGTERETDQTTTPVLKSKWPILALVFAAMYPVALVALSGLFGEEGGYLLVAARVMMAFIALLPAIWLFRLFILCRNEEPKQLQKAARQISIWDKKIDETVSTTAHENMGPSSIEFQNYFSELVSEYLSKTDRRLVIVLDNLDRVPASTARSLWATLRLFADCCESSTDDWTNRIWFIVPYDPSSAGRLWEDGQEVDRQTSAGSMMEGGDGEEHHREDNGQTVHPVAPRLSAAFLDKTFWPAPQKLNQSL